MKKLLLTIIMVASLTSPLLATTFTRVETDLDSSLSDQEATQYAEPQKILLTQIKTDAQALNTSPSDWFKSLYYYSITRLKYADIPFNYVVDRNGDVYEGRSGGIGVIPELESDSGAILIGYLSNSSDITLNASRAFEALLEDLSYKYGIPGTEVSTVKLNFLEADESRRTSKSSYEVVSDSFSEHVSKMVSSTVFSEAGHLSYKAEITKLEYAKTVKSGEKVKVSLELVNKNDFAWFTDKDLIYVSTADGAESQFAVNGVWDSFSKPLSISDKTILPGETVKLEFEMQALVLPGKNTQKFNITKLPNVVFKDSEFEVSFVIEQGDLKLVRVNGTPEGIANIRECPSPNCAVITQVNEGQVLILLEQSVGWYKLRYQDDKTAWLYGSYVQEL